MFGFLFGMVSSGLEFGCRPIGRLRRMVVVKRRGTGRSGKIAILRPLNSNGWQLVPHPCRLLSRRALNCGRQDTGNVKILHRFLKRTHWNCWASSPIFQPAY
jgi:hypothetical protein